MFTPSNQKKFTNVSIITLKKYNKTYSITVYPNKLYEYQHNITPLDQIIQSTTIYKNVSKGIKCSKEDLKLFNKDTMEIIKEIINYGHEQKNEVTRNYELEMVENQVIESLCRRVMKDSKYLTKEQMRHEVRKVYQVKNMEVKPQVLEIVNILVSKGFSRIKMKIQVDIENIKEYINNSEKDNNSEKCDGRVDSKDNEDSEKWDDKVDSKKDNSEKNNNKDSKDNEDSEKNNNKDSKDINNNEDSKDNKDNKGSLQIKDGYLFIDSVDFINFRKFCNERNIKFLVKKNIEEYEEEII